MLPQDGEFYVFAESRVRIAKECDAPPLKSPARNPRRSADLRVTARSYQAFRASAPTNPRTWANINRWCKPDCVPPASYCLLGGCRASSSSATLIERRPPFWHRTLNPQVGRDHAFLGHGCDSRFHVAFLPADPRTVPVVGGRVKFRAKSGHRAANPQ